MNIRRIVSGITFIFVLVGSWLLMTGTHIYSQDTNQTVVPGMSSEQGAAILKKQQEQLKGSFATGTNTTTCIKILNGTGKGGGKEYLAWTNIFNPGYWIPVVPDECVVCKDGGAADGKITSACPFGVGSTVPLNLSLAPLIGIRLYGLLASMSIYALVVVFMVIAIRYMVGGLSKQGRYTDTAKNLRDVFSALIITLVIATLFLQILFSVMKADANKIKIYNACTDSNGMTSTGCDMQPSP